jgi:amino acid transporter/nucleotide-binding universal stress UspA family protein
MPGSRLRTRLLGSPLPSVAERHERLSKRLALAVFSSDALSSVAYATEEILLVLAVAGTVALQWSLPVGLAIVALLAVVATSYRQTIHAYPNGGGAYIVAKENLGTVPGLTAAAALLVDYVLTVSVSVAAGVAAVVSALPGLASHREALALCAVAAVVFANLRGVKESGRIFALPTYGFIACALALIGWGIVKLVTSGAGQVPYLPHQASNPITVWLLLRAFASGCTALTGVEAISNGVPAFKRPEWRNAARTLVWMAVLLGAMFVGITGLAYEYGIVPKEDETVLSQLARLTFGGGPLYYLTQAFTMLILVLAANTSFADFPRLASLLARDGFLPRQLTHRGDRLVFSNGILVLGGLAALLIVTFGGEVHALIPLYAVGVFASFTLSQAGMVQHWRRERHAGWWMHAVVNGVGALATLIVTVIIGMTKFTHGAWIVVLLIPSLIVVFWRTRSHYLRVADNLSLEGFERRPVTGHRIVVPIGGVHRATLRAIDYARQLGPEVTAVYVDQADDGNRVLAKWAEWGNGVPIVVLDSPYRSITRPLLEYIDLLREKLGADGFVTVVLPEFIPRRWWHHLLHNQSALLLKGALLFRKNVVVVDVPFHLSH